jgi:hypothetical protein
LEKPPAFDQPSGNKPLFCTILRAARVNLARRKALKWRFPVPDQQLNVF